MTIAQKKRNDEVSSKKRRREGDRDRSRGRRGRRRGVSHESESRSVSTEPLVSLTFTRPSFTSSFRNFAFARLTRSPKKKTTEQNPPSPLEKKSERQHRFPWVVDRYLSLSLSLTSLKNAQALNNAQYIHVALSGSINLACTSRMRVCVRVCERPSTQRGIHVLPVCTYVYMYILYTCIGHSGAEIRACCSLEPCAPCRDAHTTFVHRHSRPYLHPAVIHTQRYPLLATLENPAVGSQTRSETVEKWKNNKRGDKTESLFIFILFIFFFFLRIVHRCLTFRQRWIRFEGKFPIVFATSFFVIVDILYIYILRKK